MVATLQKLPALVYLGVFSLIFGYAIFHSGGILADDWNKCVIALGVLLLFYFRFTDKQDLAPSLEWWLFWPLVLLLSFVALQLVPLPQSILLIVSPTRANLLQSLSHVSPGTLTAPISVFPPATLAHLLRVSAYMGVFLLARELAWRLRGRSWLIVAPLVVIAAAEALLGVVQYDPATSSFAHGTYASRNHFAGLLELALPFAAVYPLAAMTSRRRSVRQAVLASSSIALATVILLGVILSMSRMAFVSSLFSLFVAATITFSIRARSPQRLILLGLAAAAVISAAFFYLAPDTLIGRFSDVFSTPDVAADARVQLWSDARRLAADYRLTGSGLGTLEQAFMRYKKIAPQSGVDSLHNDYLQLLVEIGLIGFALAAVTMIALFVMAVRVTFFRGNNLSVKYLGIACLGALVAICVHSFTDFNLYIPANAMFLAWIGGVIASLNCGWENDSMVTVA